MGQGHLGDQHPTSQLENSPHPGPDLLLGIRLSQGPSLCFVSVL